MLLSVLLLCGGLAMLIFGADLLVRGVSALAAAAGVPALIIGMTVVAFGTSTPEIVVNVYSAFQEQTTLAFGNIVGANALNIGFVLGLTALIRPLDVQVSVITREIPMMLLAAVALVILSLDQLLTGEAGDVLNRSDGLILLLLFCVFLYYITLQLLEPRPTDPAIAEFKESSPETPHRSGIWIDVLLTVLGLIGVGLGGRLTVNSAVDIAVRLNVSQAVIGLTLISFGTTLPELTTSLLAARRGHADIAIGNVVGSCIFNILCIGGLVATIHPIVVEPMGRIDLLVMALLCIALWPIAMRGPRKISRAEGGLMMVTYISYLVYRSVTAVSGAT